MKRSNGNLSLADGNTGGLDPPLLMFSNTSVGGESEEISEPETDGAIDLVATFSRVRDDLVCLTSMSGLCFRGRPRLVGFLTTSLYPPIHIPRCL